jgi:hypothetical protein
MWGFGGEARRIEDTGKIRLKLRIIILKWILDIG